MAITVGTGEIKCAYLGSTALKEIYVGICKVRPVIKEAYIDFLLVGGGGGGGAGGGSCGAFSAGGGGGGGGVVYCTNYHITSDKEKCIVIGAGGSGGCGDNESCSSGNNGCPSYIFDVSGGNQITAYGGGGGGGGRFYGSGKNGKSGASGGGAGFSGYTSSYSGGSGCQGYKGGNNAYGGACGGSGGGGGAGGPGGDGIYNCRGGDGGASYCSDISGKLCGYGAGGCGVGWKGVSSRVHSGAAAFGCYNCGAGGHGSGNEKSYVLSGGGGCCGVFIARYPTACGYNITGGCKYTCGNYTIHCFTSSGTLTVG